MLIRCRGRFPSTSWCRWPHWACFSPSKTYPLCSWCSSDRRLLQCWSEGLLCLPQSAPEKQNLVCFCTKGKIRSLCLDWLSPLRVFHTVWTLAIVLQKLQKHNRLFLHWHQWELSGRPKGQFGHRAIQWPVVRFCRQAHCNLLLRPLPKDTRSFHTQKYWNRGHRGFDIRIEGSVWWE